MNNETWIEVTEFCLYRATSLISVSLQGHCTSVILDVGHICILHTYTEREQFINIATHTHSCICYNQILLSSFNQDKDRQRNHCMSVRLENSHPSVFSSVMLGVIQYHTLPLWLTIMSVFLGNVVLPSVQLDRSLLSLPSPQQHPVKQSMPLDVSWICSHNDSYQRSGKTNISYLNKMLGHHKSSEQLQCALDMILQVSGSLSEAYVIICQFILAGA